MPNVLHVIKTSKFESDGRLLKWIETLKENNIESSVYLVEDDNLSGQTVIGGVPLHKERLYFRKIFKKHRGLVVKAIELSCKWRSFLNNSSLEVIIFHDVQQYLNIWVALKYLKKNKNKNIKIIWDLHEIPHTQLSSFKPAKNIIKHLLSNTDLLVYTNDERRDFIKRIFEPHEKEYTILNNYPEQAFLNSGFNDAKDDLKYWLAEQHNKPYLLWMGAATKGRYFNVVLEAYQKYKGKLNLVVMGRIDEDFKVITDDLERKGFLFNRFVPQKDIIYYVDNALFSVVLYNSEKPNNKYCEPNRLYQLLARDIPVITGNNPTMKNIMNKFGGGVVLDSDGRDVSILEKGIESILKNYDQYVQSLKRYNKSEIFDWDKQFAEIVNFINK